jgi:SsrA-binding protein
LILLTNKKARFEYEILETFQAGLNLSGRMVSLIKNKKVNLLGKYIIYHRSQLQIIAFGNEKLTENVPLLLTKKELAKIQSNLSTKGITCIILNIKRVKRWLKAEIALVRGKKLYDKRADLKKRDLDREQRNGIF